MLPFLSFLVLTVFTALVPPAAAVELQGFVTRSCQRHVGVIVHVDETRVETIALDGRFQTFAPDEIDTLYVYNTVENPIAQFELSPEAKNRLKSVYVEDSEKPRALAFPVRFIEDLVIFYSIDGKMHVHQIRDIFKLRPAPENLAGTHPTTSSKKLGFAFNDQSANCPAPTATAEAIKPTRVLADKISIAEFLNSFRQGYENLESFQERTYLYAKPFLFEPHTRLGITLVGEREEPALNVPVFFQWSTGEAYRFQSANVVGLKNHEFTPNTEPVFSIRTEVKSHAFHALFIGNVAGLPAGNSIFLNGDLLELKGRLTVQPGFNYMALMGGDFGPYSLSAGFFYPSFGIKVGDEYREVRGSSPSYAFRAMYTKARWRLRAIMALTDYQSGSASQDDVVARTGEEGNKETVLSYKFGAGFLRTGFDYDFSPQLRASIDGIYVGGDYKESRDVGGNARSSDINFRKFTTQLQLRQSFSDYVSISGYLNLNQHNYKSNFLNAADKREQRETRFFGTLEFIF